MERECTPGSPISCTQHQDTQVAKLHEAIDKYMRCKDIEICIERLMAIDVANMENYAKEIENMATERVRPDKEVT